MERPLVVGVDGSGSSLRAADWAAGEAVRHGHPLRLVYASLWQFYDGAFGQERPTEQVTGENIVGAAAARVHARAPELNVVTEVVPKDTVRTLLDESEDASVLVTGARGRGELTGLLLGSVSLSVAARASCPVVVVRGDEAGVAGTHGRILLGVGDADVDSPAVRFAFGEAAASDRMLDVVRAWRIPASAVHGDTAGAHGSVRTHEEQTAQTCLTTSTEAAARARPDVRVRQHAIEGPPGQVLLSRTAAADLVVIGARRRPGRFGMQIGRVAHRVLHHSLCPVAVVPQEA